MLAKRSDQVFPRCRRAVRARPVLPLLCLATDLLGALGGAGAALAAMSVGSEFQVNAYTTGSQSKPSVAAGANGQFVAVWVTPEIQGQRYDASGNPAGSQFQVNTYTTEGQNYPAVAVDAAGGFVVVWTSDGSAGSDTSDWSIQGQRYDASGNELGSEFQVNTYTTERQNRSAVGVDADGDFVVVWQSREGAGSDTDNYSVQGQRYDASGNKLGSQFQVNTYTTGPQWSPSVAVSVAGDFVVVWDSYGSAGTDPYSSIQGQRYDVSGNAVGSEFQVNTFTRGLQGGASAAVDADGNFLVVWSSYIVWSGRGSADSDPDSSIQGQRYDASGNAVGSQFQVNTYTTGSQNSPSVAVDADGDFVVVWQSYGSSGGDSYFSIQGRHFGAGGNAVGSDFQVNTYATGWQMLPSVAADADGDFVVVWQSDGSGGSDSSGSSIQGQRYTVQAPPVPSLAPPGVLGLALLLLGIAAAGLRGRLRGRA